MREKDIDGYEGKYKIYEDGRVWSNYYNKFMKTHPDGCGYYQVGLSKDKKKKKFLLHRLLALHFIPNPNNLPEVDHIDVNRKNNDLSNLQWITVKENRNKKGLYKNNTLREKHICPTKEGYMVSIKRNGIRKFKRVKTLEEGIDYRDSVLMYYEIHKTLEGI